MIAGAGDHSRVVPTLGQTWQGDGWYFTALMRGLLSWSNFLSIPSRDTTAAQVRAATLNLDVCTVDSQLTGVNPARLPSGHCLGGSSGGGAPGKSESRWLTQGDAVTGARVPR